MINLFDDLTYSLFSNGKEYCIRSLFNKTLKSILIQSR